MPPKNIFDINISKTQKPTEPNYEVQEKTTADHLVNNLSVKIHTAEI